STRLIAGNRLFAVALAAALALRVVAELGYRWQSWFNDSFSYVRAAVTLTPGTTRPAGYPLYLWLLSPAHSYFLVTASQHVMGLLIAVMIYALARRRFGVPAWIAVLATLPVLFDGFEIQLEHLIMADTLFLFLVMAAITVALWSPRPSWRACLAAGLLLGLSSVVRSTGLPLLAVLAVYVIIAGWRAWRPLAVGLVACCAAFAVPVVGYAAWYSSAHGEFAMTDSTGVFLYSRVMTFADCPRMSPPADLRPLCTSVPPADRPIAQAYIWTPISPLDRYPQSKFSPTVNRLAERFAISAIEAQPLDYARAAWDDTVRSFEWNRSVFPNPQTYDAYLFTTRPVAVPSGSPYHGYSSAPAYYGHGDPQTDVVQPFAAIIRDYQRYVWLPGTVYGVILLVGLFGIVRRWRRCGRAALLPWLCSV
ncbi:MAG: phospholipid carrier-dependent glycosyltransferase, partial [Solirubrobacteraceae bacterium]